MVVVIAKNQTSEDLLITDLSVTNAVIPASGQAILSDYNTVFEIQNNSELIDYISDDKIILNIDGDDLSKSESLNASSPVIGITSGVIKDFVGATSSVDGEKGLVPKPLKSEVGTILGANGSWLSSSSVGKNYACILLGNVYESKTRYQKRTSYKDIWYAQLNFGEIPQGSTFKLRGFSYMQDENTIGSIELYNETDRRSMGIATVSHVKYLKWVETTLEEIPSSGTKNLILRIKTNTNNKRIYINTATLEIYK